MKKLLKSLVLSVVFLQISLNIYANKMEIFGKWEVVSQSPTQKELLRIAAKTLGMQHTNSDDDGFVEVSQIVSISENAMIWESKGKGVSGSIKSLIQIKGKKIKTVTDGQGANSAWADYVAKFTPKYYVFNFDSGNLVLISNKIKAYENRKVEYVLKRIK